MGVIPRAPYASWGPLCHSGHVSTFPLSPDRVNRLHRGASMPKIVVHTAGCYSSVRAECTYTAMPGRLLKQAEHASICSTAPEIVHRLQHVTSASRSWNTLTTPGHC